MRMTLTDAGSCEPAHDRFALLLSSCLCIGIIISYLPQHVRIVMKRSSEGFSPVFLLLGSTSSAAGMLNMVTLQWGMVKCCRRISAGSCFESTIGILQVFLQWLCFTIIVVLYLIYFPRSVKFAEYRPVAPEEHASDICECPKCVAARGEPQVMTTGEWKVAITLCGLVAVHFITCLFVTLLIVLSSSSASPVPAQSASPRAELWAGFLGVSSMILAAWQYAPQLWKTYKKKLVGALSIPMMCIQTPGSALFVVSLAIREGTNWTSWLTYAVTGVLQGALLVMCLCWRVRQHRLHVDDFGNPLLSDMPHIPSAIDERPTPESPAAVEEAAEEADAVPSNGAPADSPIDESTPLMVKTSRATGKLILPTFFRRGR